MMSLVFIPMLPWGYSNESSDHFHLSKGKANKVPDRGEDKKAHIVGKQGRRWDYTSEKLSVDLIHTKSRHHLTDL